MVYLVRTLSRGPTATALTAAAIDRRLDQITANAVLNAEIAALAWTRGNATPLRIHRLAAEDEVEGLSQASPADLGRGFVTLLRERLPDIAAHAAELAALDDTEHVRRSVEMNRQERQRLYNELGKLGLSPVPSETNFLFISIGPHAKSLCDELLLEGVIVRPLGWMGFPEAIRISVGSPAENTKLLGAISYALERRKASVLAPR